MTNKKINEDIRNIKWFMEHTEMPVYVIDSLNNAIKAVKSQKWIPVSKPPKENCEYLVTLVDKDSNGDDIFVTDKAYWTGMNWTYKFLIVENVIAYKPLPKPYKESDKNAKLD